MFLYVVDHWKLGLKPFLTYFYSIYEIPKKTLNV